MATFHASEIKSLVYLHAAMCETLRLYPPIPFEFKTAAAADVLPCGKVLKAGDKVLFFNYAMSRMEGVWGKDCMEFRPERWITEEGSLRYEPSYKFFSFNTGPRTCLGKDMAFVLTKTVAAAMLWNFAFEVVPGHVVEPKLSIILHMKNGLLVRVRRRAGTMSSVGKLCIFGTFMLRDMDPFFLSIELLSVLCFFLLILYYHHLQSKKTSPLEPIEWPIVGHLPVLIANIHRFHDWTTGVLAGVGYNYEGRLGWTGLRYFMACDPSNVRHVFTSNFANYPKGDEFASTFDILGDGILNADGESWRRQRVKVQTLMADPRFRRYTARCSHDKVEKSLLPFLALAADEGRPCDLLEVFMRLMFDVTCALVCGVDPGCLVVTGELPVVPFMRATDVVLETIFLRHIIPMPCWKLMRRLNVGPERKMAVARRTIDGFMADTIAARRTDMLKLNDGATATADSADLLSSFLSHENTSTDEFIRDTTLSLLFAGRDTVAAALAWFFYLVSTNPPVEKKLLDELSSLATTASSGMATFDASEVSSLVYLHAVLCETLRLYPPIPFEFKTAAAGDVLPSGKALKPGDKVLFLNYAMGRMEGVWGRGCMEFDPERWVTEEGGLRYEPSHKFNAFNTGPRMCLGKDMAFVMIKTVAAAMLWNFAVEVVPGHVVEPRLSIILLMKNGLVVRVRRRS
ncbi:hypothetical protein U9M48_006069 [Paspalum notatum var. saurae]|uniref:Cytochrome P450 86B1 n=1 Tax=Paspalum notatum var. saurae TaxID=547442 RepID=A0AAQ3PN88_PASNO